MLLRLRNAGRTSMTIDGVSGPGLAGARGGLPPVSTRLPLRVGGGRTEAFTLKLRPGTCGNRLAAQVRYRVLGRTLREPLRLTASGLRSC